MKKKIIFWISSIALIGILSVATLKTAKADYPIDPVELCNTWCISAQGTCVLHIGFPGGTMDINCEDKIWP